VGRLRFTINDFQGIQRCGEMSLVELLAHHVSALNEVDRLQAELAKAHEPQWYIQAMVDAEPVEDPGHDIEDMDLIEDRMFVYEGLRVVSYEVWSARLDTDGGISADLMTTHATLKAATAAAESQANKADTSAKQRTSSDS
jgi:hypothetical protein